MQAPSTPVGWLTVPQLAARYDVTIDTVYNWNKAGTGPPYLKPGGRTSACRYRMTDVLAWERTRMHGTRLPRGGERVA